MRRQEAKPKFPRVAKRALRKIEGLSALTKKAGDKGKSPANANGPTLGVPAWIIQTDARLQPENLNVNSV